MRPDLALFDGRVYSPVTRRFVCRGQSLGLSPASEPPGADPVRATALKEMTQPTLSDIPCTVISLVAERTVKLH